MNRSAVVLTLVSAIVPAYAQAPDAGRKEPADLPGGRPIVSAKGWAVADGRTGAVLWDHDGATPRPIASTTKIMTAHIVLRAAAADPKVLDEVVTVSERADKTGGSTAGLKAGERVTVGDLLYGLLLPSGNDAAAAFAEHFGPRFRPKGGKGGDAVAWFVAEMNRTAAELKMTGTTYLDPHGLGKNESTPRDLAALTFAAAADPNFLRYVGTRTKSGTLTPADGPPRTATWSNTNKLLGIDGYDGVKTGTTAAAGSCLVARGSHGDDRLIVVVLGAGSNDGRYADARTLFMWAWAERGGKK